MIQIEMVNENNYSFAHNFLTSVPSISEIDDNILKNGCIVVEGKKILGSIAYEDYDRVGLIRYFVFKKNLSDNILTNLMVELEKVAKTNNIEKLLCVADNNEIEVLFEALGFTILNKKIFLNEEKIGGTSFKESKFLIKSIV